MNDKTRHVFRGWLSLSDSEKSDFDDQVRRFKFGTGQEQRNLRESVTKVASGPLHEGCPCCGR